MPAYGLMYKRLSINWTKNKIFAVVMLAILVMVLFFGLIQVRETRFPAQSEIPDLIWQLDQVMVNGTHIQPNHTLDEHDPLMPQQIQIVGGSQKEIRGTDGCNSFRGPLDYSPESARFRLTEFSRTLTGCVVESVQEVNGEWITVETFHLDVVFDGNEFLPMLNATEWYEVNESNLKLYSKDGQQVLIFIPSSERFRFRELPAP